MRNWDQSYKVKYYSLISPTWADAQASEIFDSFDFFKVFAVLLRILTSIAYGACNLFDIGTLCASKVNGVLALIRHPFFLFFLLFLYKRAACRFFVPRKEHFDYKSLFESLLPR